MRLLLFIFFCILTGISFSQDIFEACRKGDTTEILIMIEINPDTVNVSNEGGFTPLILASYRNQIQVVELLLNYKVKINSASGEGTALMGACFKGNLEIVHLLLEHGADVNIPNELGTTCLMYAILGQNIDLVRILLKNGADKDVKEKSGKTAFDYANQGKSEAIRELLK
jgi:ankyrin repeat protein